MDKKDFVQVGKSPFAFSDTSKEKQEYVNQELKKAVLKNRALAKANEKRDKEVNS